MFDMEQALTLWRRRMLDAGIKTPVPLEELEEHLREEIEEQLALGTEAQLAFNTAIEKLGKTHALHAEFVKLDRFAFMKTFNRRLAGRVLGGLISFDAAFFILSHIFPGTWAAAPWWIVNAPGFPVAFYENKNPWSSDGCSRSDNGLRQKIRSCLNIDARGPAMPDGLETGAAASRNQQIC
jgi:hypothetical protein